MKNSELKKLVAEYNDLKRRSEDASSDLNISKEKIEKYQMGKKKLGLI